MDLESFHRLLTPFGQEVLAAAQSLEPVEDDFLAHFTSLSRLYPPDLARAALETAILRREAGAKFPSASLMYFTREALEQATHSAVSAYRSERYRSFRRLADLGCSVGGDTQALVAIAPTIGLDLNQLRLEIARANLAALGLGDRAFFIQTDLAQALPVAPDPNLALFFDPARREGGRRAFSVRDYHPPLNVVQHWQERFPAIGVKVSPGVKLAELADYQAEIEFISLDGELKEAVLWFGPLRSAARRATLLPGAYSLNAAQEPEAPANRRLSPPLNVLYEPDPAVLRAGLVTDLAELLDAAQLDPEIAYLTAGEAQPTPYARSWLIEDWFPFQLKRLRAYLRERRIGKIVVKKRGSPLEPEALIRSLRLEGENERVVVLTQLLGKPVVIIALNQPGS